MKMSKGFAAAVLLSLAAVAQAHTHLKEAAPAEGSTVKAAPENITLTFSEDRKSTRLNSSHSSISYAVFCLKKKSSFTNWLISWYQLHPQPLPTTAFCPLLAPAYQQPRTSTCPRYCAPLHGTDLTKQHGPAY